jgi:hypothetical protein
VFGRRASEELAPMLLAAEACGSMLLPMLEPHILFYYTSKHISFEAYPRYVTKEASN